MSIKDFTGTVTGLAVGLLLAFLMSDGTLIIYIMVVGGLYDITKMRKP